MDRRTRRNASSPGSVDKPIADKASTASVPSSSHLPTTVWPIPLESALKSSLKSAFNGLKKTFSGVIVLSFGLEFVTEAPRRLLEFWRSTVPIKVCSMEERCNYTITRWQVPHPSFFIGSSDGYRYTSRDRRGLEDGVAEADRRAGADDARKG